MKKIVMDWACGTLRVLERTIQGLVGKSEGKRIFGKCMLMWGDHVMDIRNIRWKCVTCLDVAQDRDGWRAVVNAVMNFQVP
jgi:hypothetical protein